MVINPIICDTCTQGNIKGCETCPARLCRENAVTTLTSVRLFVLENDKQVTERVTMYYSNAGNTKEFIFTSKLWGIICVMYLTRNYYHLKYIDPAWYYNPALQKMYSQAKSYLQTKEGGK